MTLENDGYFGKFCSFFNSEECIDKAKAAERGEISKETYYDWLIKTFGEDKVAQAHLHAADSTKQKNAKEEIAEKIKALQHEKADIPPKPEQQEHKLPAAPSSIDALCRICVTPVSIGIFSVLREWHVKEKGKIDSILDRLEREEMQIEDAYVEILTEIDDSIDSLNRVLDDLNKVLEFSLNKAAEKKPELKERFMRELNEMQGNPQS